MNTKILLFVMIFLIVGVSCNKNGNKNKSYIPDQEIDMSTDLLMSDESVLTSSPEYSKIRGGESQTIDRSFENAPPLIPHKVAGLLDITAGNNQCLKCHLPDKAETFKATPMPKTHFTSFRPKVIEKDGVYLVDAKEGEVTINDLGHFSDAMYNCSQCHVAQANVTLDVANMFDADYRKSGDKSNSNLIDVMDEGIN